LPCDDAVKTTSGAGYQAMPATAGRVRSTTPSLRFKPAAGGLTGSRRPLYSAGFATLAFWPASEGPCGGIGRRARLKIEFRKECWFDSGQGHQKLFRNDPPSASFRWYPTILLVSLLVAREAVGIAIPAWNRTHAHTQRCRLSLCQAARKAFQTI
jgi:hypothetical protein